jgi:hypothetical protein
MAPTSVPITVTESPTMMLRPAALGTPSDLMAEKLSSVGLKSNEPGSVRLAGVRKAPKKIHSSGIRATHTATRMSTTRASSMGALALAPGATAVSTAAALTPPSPAGAAARTAARWG